jgi:thymidylate synthase (FAD)
MKLIFEPKVHLVTSSLLLDGELSWYTDFDFNPTGLVTDLDAIPELAGRVCYQSFSKPRTGGNEAYIQHVIEAGHGSVLEHSYVGLILTGVSRALTHELIRHRAGTAFSQLSQRYVQPEEFGFVVPPLLLQDEGAIDAFKTEVAASVASYNAMLTTCTTIASREWQKHNPNETAGREALTHIRKKAREAARATLPNCAETHIFMSGNLRAWRNIVEQRGSIHADLEIRRLACAIAQRLQDAAPKVFFDIQVAFDVDGHKSVFVTNRKV